MKDYRKIWAIPDIHGRSDLLRLALKKIHEDGFDEATDLVVFLGDYIDRGPDSRGVLNLIKHLVDKGTAKAVRGNHDDFAITYYVRNAGKDIWMHNGGYSTMSSYGNGPLGRMSEEHVKFLALLPDHLEIQGFFFSHAPVPREKLRGSVGAYTHYELTWTYFGPESEKKGDLFDVHEGPISPSTGEHLTGICGHIHRLPNIKTVRIFPKYRLLDSGCGCSDTAPLAIHECVSNRTLYATPKELDETK